MPFEIRYGNPYSVPGVGEGIFTGAEQEKSFSRYVEQSRLSMAARQLDLEQSRQVMQQDDSEFDRRYKLMAYKADEDQRIAQAKAHAAEFSAQQEQKNEDQILQAEDKKWKQQEFQAKQQDSLDNFVKDVTLKGGFQVTTDDLDTHKKNVDEYNTLVKDPVANKAKLDELLPQIQKYQDGGVVNRAGQMFFVPHEAAAKQREQAQAAQRKQQADDKEMTNKILEHGGRPIDEGGKYDPSTHYVQDIGGKMYMVPNESKRKLDDYAKEQQIKAQYGTDDERNVEQHQIGRLRDKADNYDKAIRELEKEKSTYDPKDKRSADKVADLDKRIDTFSKARDNYDKRIDKFPKIKKYRAALEEKLNDPGIDDQIKTAILNHLKALDSETEWENSLEVLQKTVKLK